MNVDKRHLAGALLLLVAAIAYNVWVFTRPPTGAAARQVRGPAPVDALPGPTAAGAPGVQAPIDAVQIPPVADVALDQLPEWPRNPFENPRRIVTTAALDVAPVAPPPEPDVVVATILYSPQRRLAMVNGRIAGVGDKVGSATIVEIQPKAIVIDSPTAGRKTIALTAASGSLVRR